MRNYYVSVYLQPAVVVIFLLLLFYWITGRYGLDPVDRLAGYFISIIAGLILYFMNKFNWLPLPDGSHIHRKELVDEKDDIANHQNPISNAPETWIAEFREPIINRIISIVIGLVMMIISAYSVSSSFIILPSVVLILAVILLFYGVRNLVLNRAELKLAKEGLWTDLLGFIPWTSIHKVEIGKGKFLKSKEECLNIYLKGEDHLYPVESLPLKELKNRKNIPSLLDDLFNRNART